MRIQNTSRPFSRPGLDFIVALYARSQMRYYDRYTEAQTNKHAFFTVATEGDFPTANPYGEGETINVDDFQTPYYMNVTPQLFAIGYAQSSLSESSDLYGVYAKHGTKMVDSVLRAQEYNVSDLFNLGSSTVTTPDGVSFFSAAHLYALGTFSNIVTGNPVLSITSLAAAKQQLLNQPSHEGNPMAFTGPFILLVPPALMDRAYRLTHTVQGRQPQSGADADMNWGGQDVEVVECPFFTSTTAWALVDKRNNPMKNVTRRGLISQDQKDITRDGTIYTVTKVWAPYAADPRGIVYSAGA